MGTTVVSQSSNTILKQNASKFATYSYAPGTVAIGLPTVPVVCSLLPHSVCKCVQVGLNDKSLGHQIVLGEVKQI